MSWQEITDGLESKDARRKLEATSQLRDFLIQNSLSASQIRELLGHVCNCISDNNIKICERGLSLASQFLEIVGGSADIKIFAPSMLAAVGEKLGDAKQGIREEACTLLVQLGKMCGARYLLEKILESEWWSHKNWRMRQGAASVAADVSSKAGIDKLTEEVRHQLLIEPCVILLEDPNSSVRDAAVDCLEELFLQMGHMLEIALKRYTMQPSTVRELLSKFEARQQSTSTLPDAPGSQVYSRSTVDRRNSSASKANTKASGLGDGEQSGLPRVDPVKIETDRELKEEVQKIIEGLSLSEEWDKRIVSLVRLEGIVRGGAARLDSCCELFKSLKDPLTAQINDRRSAVSRQACHLVATIAAALGSRFEADAIFFLPVIFKVLIITVQVMADAADLCVHSILRYCRGGRLVPKICEVLVSDRNSKSRQHCSKFLLQVLEEWPRACYERQLEAIENGIKCTSQDTTSETRLMGRLAFGAYYRAYPDRARAFLKKLDGGLQQKLNTSLSEYRPGMVLFQTIDPLPEDVLPLVKQVEAVHSANAQTPRNKAYQSSNPVISSPSTAISNLPTGRNRVAANVLTPISELAGKKHLQNETVMTAPLAATDNWWFTANQPGADETSGKLDEAAHLSGRRLSVFGGPQRCQADGMSGSKGSFVGTPGSLGSVRARDLEEEGMSDQGHALRENPSDSVKEMSQNSGEQSVMRGLELSRLLNLSQIQEKSDWQGKVEVLDKIYELLEKSNWTYLQLGHEAHRVTQFFKSRIEDAHFRVVEKALKTLCLVIMRMPQIFSMYLDRLIPLLFYKLVDQKDHIQKQSKQALEAVALGYKADYLLPALIRSLESMKVPRGHIAILEFFCMCLGRDAPAGVPTIPTLLRQWIGRVVAFLSDKNLDVRRMAVNALQNVHENMDASALTSYFVQSSPQDQAILRKILGPLFAGVTVPEERQPSSANKGKPLQSITTPQAAPHKASIQLPDNKTDDYMSKPRPSNPQIDSVPAKEAGSLPSGTISKEARNVTNFDWVIGRLLSGQLSRDILENANLHVKLAETDRLKPIFNQIVSTLVQNLKDEDDGLQQSMLGLLRRFIVHHSSLVNSECTRVLLQSMLHSCVGRPQKVCMEMADTVAALVAQRPTREAFAELAGYLSTNLHHEEPEDAGRVASIQSCIQGISTMILQMNTDEIAQVFQEGIARSLTLAWRSPNACTRQDVVQCMATACYKIGPRQTTELIESMSLSTCQEKLLEFYINRMKMEKTM